MTIFWFASACQLLLKPNSFREAASAREDFDQDSKTLKPTFLKIALLATFASANFAHSAAMAQDSNLSSEAEGLANQASGTAPGVNPKDNITKGEFVANYVNLDSGVSTLTSTFKYDMAFDEKWGGNVEVPLTHVITPRSDTFGLSDVNVRVRHVSTSGQFSIVKGAELVVPTATSNLTGSGKWQLNPSLGVVYAIDQLTFWFVGYKHSFSFAGDDSRVNINRSEIRTLVAKLSTKGTWMLGDIKYSKALNGSKPEVLDLEVEYGSMLSKSVGLSGRIGTSFLDSNRDFGLSLNLRKIF
jgi:hypothetical protein